MGCVCNIEKTGFVVSGERRMIMVKYSKLIVFCFCTVMGGFFIHAAYTAEAESFFELFNIVYGYINFQEYGSMTVTLIKWMIPQLLLIFFWGDYLESNLMDHLDYILTRTNKIGKYLLIVYSKLFCFVLLACVVLYAMTAAAVGDDVGGMGATGPMVQYMFTYCVYLFLMLVLVNSLSIFMKAAYASFAVMTMEIIMLEIIKLIADGVITESIYCILPTSAVLFYYNGASAIAGSPFSPLFLILILFVVLTLNVVILKKKEAL